MSIFDVLIVQPIFNLLVGIYSIVPGGDFGVSIIIFTILLRFAMYPLVVKQLHQVKAMRKLQPELEKIKKKTKNNKQQQAMQMMELYKKHGVSPFRSIGILLIQLPIFIALFGVIRIFTNHRDKIEAYTYNFMEHLPGIKDIIANTDQFNEKLFGIIDLTQSAISSNGFNIALVLFAVIAAGTQYIMSKQTMPQTENNKRLRQIMAEAAEGKAADQSEINAVMMRKMVKVLPLIMLFVMLSLPGALSLYYATSNIVATIQQHFILKRDEDDLEKIASEPEPMKKKTKKTAKTTKKTPSSRAKNAKKAKEVKS